MSWLSQTQRLVSNDPKIHSINAGADTDNKTEATSGVTFTIEFHASRLMSQSRLPLRRRVLSR